jgi:hypothetical protein
MRLPKMPKEFPKIKIPQTFLVQFIPIILVTLFLLYPVKMVQESRTLLGKILAVIIVVFYTFVDKLYGVLSCGIIILFYQIIYEFNQHTEGMDTNCNKNETKQTSEIEDVVGWKYIANNVASSNLGNAIGEESCLIGNQDPSVTVGGNIKFEEGMITYEKSSQEQKINTPDETPKKDSEEFKATHCDNGILRYKGAKVNLEMASLVFPQLKYKGKTCNPCDTSCEYNIDNKLALEEEMLKPKESNSWFESVWNSVWKSNSPEIKDYEGKINTPTTLFLQ